MRASSALLFVALVGCSTVQGRRDDPPTFQTTTPKSLSDIEGCLSDWFANRNEVRFMPRKNGGTYSAVVGLYQTYVPWVVDVDDLGQARRVSVHAVGSIWGPDKKIAQQVQSCL